MFCWRKRARQNNFVCDRPNLSLFKTIEGGIERNVSNRERAGRVVEIGGGG